MKYVAPFVVTCLCAIGWAVDIPVKPGVGTISAAAANAKDGDVLVLEAGEFTDAVVLGVGVELRGAGAGKTILIANSGVAINCTGERTTVRDLSIRGSQETRRGINTSSSVRVERVAFEKISEAVALMGAPLSDVVYCDFFECGIGVRAIAESCPTVWGCRFKGGRMGIFAMQGAPYVRHNTFEALSEGIRLIVGETAIIRNNAFVACETAIVLADSERALVGPSFRNNIFAGGNVGAKGPTKFTNYVSHGVYDAMKGPIIADEAGVAIAELPLSIRQASVGVTLGVDGAIAYADRAALSGIGLRTAAEPEGTKGDIGPDATLTHVGTAAPSGSVSPPVRFRGEEFIVNAVAEEYQAMRMWGRRIGGQSTGTGKNGSIDVVESGGQKVTFDISRFFGEPLR